MMMMMMMSILVRCSHLSNDSKWDKKHGCLSPKRRNACL